MAFWAPDGGLALACSRGLAEAGMMSAAGVLLFRATLAPAVPDLNRALRRLGRASTVVALVALLAWVGLQAADMASATTAEDTLAALPAVLGQTRFGHLTLAQLGGCLVLLGVFATGTSARRGTIGLAAGAACLLAQVLRTHAGTSGDPILFGSELAHLVAAAAWLGALLPLRLAIRLAPPEAGLATARRFGVYGGVCVATLAATALLQGNALIGGLPRLVGTAYGRLALLKLGLFAILLGFAAVNRTWFTPGLGAADPVAARRRIDRSIALEAAFGLLIVLVAATLGQSTPAVHQQPVWPFAWRVSLVTVSEDAEFRAEVLWAAAGIAAALILLLAAALLRGWRRWAALVVAPALAAIALPHVSLLLVPANPDSFMRSPTDFSTASILRGQGLYPAACAACHGAGGLGDGPAAGALPVPPADLTAAHLWAHADGDLLWWLSHGITASDGRPAMPGFAASLSLNDRWALIDYIRARNAGAGFGRDRAWPMPLAAPDFSYACLTPATLRGTRGAPALLVFGAARPASTVGVRTIWIDPAARRYPESAPLRTRRSAPPTRWSVACRPWPAPKYWWMRPAGCVTCNRSCNQAARPRGRTPPRCAPRWRKWPRIRSPPIPPR